MRVHTFLVKVSISVIFLLFLGATAGFAGFPERQIELVVGQPVGSTNDSIDRAIAKPLSQILGQKVIVKNVPGASATIPLLGVKKVKPDGYTIFQSGMNTFNYIPLQRHVSYDPLKDFAYLAQNGRMLAYILGRPDNPWKSFEELIQYTKKNPRKVKYTTSGVGSAQHNVMQYLAMKEKLEWTHVPCDSSVESFTTLLGGHVDIGALNLGSGFEHVKSGRLLPIICLNKARIPQLPNLPTITEKGYEFYSRISTLWAVPIGTQKDVQKILEKALLQAFKDPEVQSVMENWGVAYEPLDSEATTKEVFTAHESYRGLMKSLKLGIFKK